MLKAFWGDIIKKNYVVGIVYKIMVMRDIRNNTYRDDIQFINDKENIINLLNINTSKYDISICDTCIIITLKKSNNISNDKVLRCDGFTFDNILDIDKLNDIDLDENSKYYPIKLDTFIIEYINSNNKDIYAFGYSYK